MKPIGEMTDLSEHRSVGGNSQSYKCSSRTMILDHLANQVSCYGIRLVIAKVWPKIDKDQC